MREPTDTLDDLDTKSIEKVLRSSPVTLGVIYGSHARDETTETSDVDVAVVFEDDLSSADRTRMRLSLIERLSAALGTEDVDVVPLAETPPTLRTEICDDGIVVVGTETALDHYCDPSWQPRTHEECLAEFDELLTEIDQVV